MDELISVSTNAVSKVTVGGREYIKKRLAVSNAEPSPFWAMMRALFGLDLDDLAIYARICGDLLENPHINVAKLAGKAAGGGLLFHREQGRSHMPDEFPIAEGVSYDLGLFLGYIHRLEYAKFGTVEAPAHTDFEAAAKSAMRNIVNAYRGGDSALHELIECASLPEPPGSFSPVMADISANQFLFSQDKSNITSVVDLDAYVIAPREWELAIVELCAIDAAAFRKAYETYRQLPDISESRGFYRLIMALCDPGLQDIEGFISLPALFS